MLTLFCCLCRLSCPMLLLFFFSSTTKTAQALLSLAPSRQRYSVTGDGADVATGFQRWRNALPSPHPYYDSQLFLSSSPIPTSSLSDNNDETTKASQDALGSGPSQHTNAVVCGGGPAGLLTAIMLAQKLPTSSSSSNKGPPQIRVYDRLSPPPHPDHVKIWSNEGYTKFYLLGLGGRGQAALKHMGVWDDVEQRCVHVVGRKDYLPGGPPEGVERIFTGVKTTARVLPRDKLVAVLYQYIQDHYADRISLHYNYELEPIDFDYAAGKQVLVQVRPCTDETVRETPSSVVKVATPEPVEHLACGEERVERIAADLLVAADGTVRTVANAMETKDQEHWSSRTWFQRIFAPKPFSVKKYTDDNPRVYKTLPIKLPRDGRWRFDLNYSARSKGGEIAFDALPASLEGDYCGALLLKKDDPLARANTDPAELRRRLDEDLPQFSCLLSDAVVEKVAQKPVSYLPGFRYAGPRLHQGNRCVLLGDCAHTVKPYFGLGANSALQDVQIFGAILDENDLDLTQSVLDYSQCQAKQAKALVRLSRDLDRPGLPGFFTFVLPLILDSIFHRAMPRVFAPNMIATLQKESYTFQQVGRRKRMDRLFQVLTTGGIVWFLLALVRFGFSHVLSLTALFSRVNPFRG